MLGDITVPAPRADGAVVRVETSGYYRSAGTSAWGPKGEGREEGAERVSADVSRAVIGTNRNRPPFGTVT